MPLRMSSDREVEEGKRIHAHVLAEPLRGLSNSRAASCQTPDMADAPR